MPCIQVTFDAIDGRIADHYDAIQFGTQAKVLQGRMTAICTRPLTVDTGFEKYIFKVMGAYTVKRDQGYMLVQIAPPPSFGTSDSPEEVEFSIRMDLNRKKNSKLKCFRDYFRVL